MAAIQESAAEILFRFTVHDVARGLTLENCHSLKFIYNLSQQSRDKDMPGLEIMKELMAQNTFSYQEPNKLVDLLSRIKREDLNSLVKKYKGSGEFKSMQKLKEHHKKAESKRGKNKTSEEQKKALSLLLTGDKGCDHVSVALMHAAQTVGQTRYFLGVMTPSEHRHKKEMTAVAKDFERLLKSLNKAITSVADCAKTEATLQPGKNSGSSSTHSSLSSNLSSQESNGSRALTESCSSTESDKSEESSSTLNRNRNQEFRETDQTIEEISPNTTVEDCSFTGDSGYGVTEWKLTVPDPADSVADEEEHDYDELLPVQESEHKKYKKLDVDTKDGPHEYAYYKK